MNKMINCADETTQEQLGEELAQATQDACVIYLEGELGSGKTTLARGFIQGKGYQGTIKSPSYTLVEIYECSPWVIIHADFYRLQAEEELEYLDVRDWATPHSIQLIEWPVKGGSLVAKPDIYCYIMHVDNGRAIQFQAPTSLGQKILTGMSF